METDKFLTIAKEAATKAGDFLAKGNTELRRVNTEDGRDVKIEADLQSESLLIDFLNSKTDFPILSEERGIISGKDETYQWIVDPVDGSLNYSRGVPICCVSIGLWKKDKPVLGVIYDFNRNELFSGIAGKKAWLNDRSITVSRTEDKVKSVLCTGFPIKTDFEPQRLTAFVDQIRDFKKTRLIGSAALSIAYVAAGRVEGYCERDIMWWDIAGGIPIVLGAGGKTQVQNTNQKYCYDVYVTNGRINIAR